MDDDALTPGLARVTEFLQHHCFEVLTIEDRRDQGPVLTMETRRQGQRHRLCLTRGLLTSAMLAQALTDDLAQLLARAQEVVLRERGRRAARGATTGGPTPAAQAA
jgi:hypothetical protein